MIALLLKDMMKYLKIQLLQLYFMQNHKILIQFIYKHIFMKNLVILQV